MGALESMNKEDFIILDNDGLKREIGFLSGFNYYLPSGMQDKFELAFKLKDILLKNSFEVKISKRKQAGNINFKVTAQRGVYTYGTSGNNYFMPIIELYEWIKRTGEL
jgi:hypothetical protein